MTLVLRDIIRQGGSLFCDEPWFYFDPHAFDGQVQLDGWYSAEDLRDLAVYMLGILSAIQAERAKT